MGVTSQFKEKEKKKKATVKLRDKISAVMMSTSVKIKDKPYKINC